MPATTIASSGAPPRSDLRMDAFGSWVMLAAQRLPLGLARASRRRARAEALQQVLERRAGVAREREGLRVVTPDLPGIHVDLDHLLLGLRRGEGQAAADDEDHVSRFEVPPERALRPEPGPEREVARVADRALALRRLDDA